MTSTIQITSSSRSDLLQLIRSLEAVSSTLGPNIQKYSQGVIDPEWKKAVAARSSTPLERKFLAGTALASVGPTNVIFSAGAISAAVSGGLSTTRGGLRGDGWRAVEFGANRNAVRTYLTRSPRGTQYRVTRHTQRQFKWANHQKGIAVYPAASELIDRAVELWVQTSVRLIHDGVEGKL